MTTHTSDGVEAERRSSNGDCVSMKQGEKNFEHEEHTGDVSTSGTGNGIEENEEEWRFTIGQFLALAVRTI